jgi:hypothetical protein
MKKHDIKRRIFAAIIVLISISSALVVICWKYRFFPRDRVEIRGPNAANRAFTYKTGFVDTSIQLCAADWPHSFWEPVSLGDLYWPEIFSSRNVHWSHDGSAIAVRTCWKTGPAELFTAAYDFQNHQFFRQVGSVGNPLDIDRRIQSLLAERGGVGAIEPNIDDGKTQYTTSFPLWGWIAPGVIVSLGVVCAFLITRSHAPIPISPKP